MVLTEKLKNEFENLSNEVTTAEKEHDEYHRLNRDVKKREEKCRKRLIHLKYVYRQLCNDLKKACLGNRGELYDAEVRSSFLEIEEKKAEISTKLVEMERGLPAESNGIYLSIILGSNLSVSFLTPDERYRYKKEYESFKAKVTFVILGIFFLACFISFRPMDAICNFLLVWYYCTLTIRESILRVNGSRIKGWWVFHHYVSCVLCGINLTWTMSNSQCYEKVRPVFIFLVLYIGTVQLLQWRYQSGCLRRLHALGQRHTMDITVEGFTSWMFKGLTFLLPFLVFGYILQGYCGFLLARLYLDGCSNEWQVIVLASLFGFVTLGNLLTTALTVFRKIFQLNADSIRSLTMKYREKIL